MPKRRTLEAPKTCAIYTRVSTARQAEEGQSITSQYEQCLRYAEWNKLEVVQHFSDPGASAWKDKGRKEFNRMVAEALASPRRFDVILVLDRSRFYRRQVEARTLREKLRRNGVQVRSVHSDIEDDGRIGSLAIAFEELNAEFSSNLTSDKVRLGLEANARAGFFSGGLVPYGYKLQAVEMRGGRAKNKLVLNPVEAAVVLNIFQRHARGIGVNLIAQQLNEEGVRTRDGGLWYKGRIGKILVDETYAGHDWFRPTDIITGERLPREDWIDIPCPPIVDELMFQNTQDRLRTRAPNITAPPPYNESCASRRHRLLRFLRLTSATRDRHKPDGRGSPILQMFSAYEQRSLRRRGTGVGAGGCTRRCRDEQPHGAASYR